MSNGSFLVKSGGDLIIENCIVNATIKPTNPYLFKITGHSKLRIANNDFNITSQNVPTHEDNLTIYQILRIDDAENININTNNFYMDEIKKVGLMISSASTNNKNLNFSDNSLYNFHGGLYLLNYDDVTILRNHFEKINLSNIFHNGNNISIEKNKILFGGYNFGHVIDLVNSNNAEINKNIVANSGCVSVGAYGHDILIDSNTIVNGKTYGIEVKKEILSLPNAYNITISNNYIGQNRYSFSLHDINNIHVMGNYVTQRFLDAKSRKFWTNNDNIFSNVTGLSWDHNYYQEAFTQVNGGDNSMVKLVPFPASGGVVL
jgi:hypothetical protein